MSFIVHTCELTHFGEKATLRQYKNADGTTGAEVILESGTKVAFCHVGHRPDDR